MASRSAARVVARGTAAALGARGGVALTAVVLASCGGAAPAAAPAVEERVVLVELMERRRADDALDTLPLFHAADLIGWGDTLVVVDGGNDRLVLFDRALSVIGVMGRAGAGPDELERPFSIAQWPGGVVVGDQGNTRFAVYGRDGSFRRTIAAPRIPFSIAVGSGGELYLPMYLPDTYLLRMDTAGRVAPLAPRPGPARAAPGERRPPITLDLVAVTAGDTIHVLDNERGRLLKYTPAGRLVLDRPLPVVTRELVEERTARARAAVGALYAGGFARRMVVTPDGRLLVLVKADGVWALLLDPADYSGTALRLPESQPAATLLRDAAAAYYAPPSLFILSQDDLVRLRITDPPPP